MHKKELRLKFKISTEIQMMILKLSIEYQSVIQKRN